MRLTADALLSLGNATESPRAKVDDFVAQTARNRPLPPTRGSISPFRLPDDSPHEAHSLASAEEQKDVEPLKSCEKRKVDDTQIEQEEQERDERLTARKQRRLTRKSYEMGPASPDEESEVEAEAHKKRRQTIVDMLGPAAGRRGHHVGQGRITSKPGFLNSGVASEQIKPRHKHVKPCAYLWPHFASTQTQKALAVPDLAFNELDFLTKSSRRRSSKEERPAGSGRERPSAELASKHFRAPSTEERTASQPETGKRVACNKSPESVASHVCQSRQVEDSSGGPPASSAPRSPTSAYSMLLRRKENKAPSEQATLVIEVPKGLQASSKSPQPQLRQSGQHRRSNSVPLAHCEPPSAQQEKKKPCSIAPDPIRGFYSDSDQPRHEAASHPAMSAQAVESLHNAARQSSRDQHIFLADITPRYPWSTPDIQPVTESEGHISTNDTKFAIYDDVMGEWQTTRTCEGAQLDYDPGCWPPAERDCFQERLIDDSDADTIADDEHIDSFIDEYVVPSALAATRQQTPDRMGVLPPPHWLLSPAPPRPASPPRIRRIRPEITQPVMHDAAATEEMRSFWYRARP